MHPVGERLSIQLPTSCGGELRSPPWVPFETAQTYPKMDSLKLRACGDAAGQVSVPFPPPQWK